MKTRFTNLRRSKSDDFRFRCATPWKQKLFEVAALTDQDAADLVRVAVNEKIEALTAANPVIRLHVTR